MYVYIEPCCSACSNNILATEGLHMVTTSIPKMNNDDYVYLKGVTNTVNYANRIIITVIVAAISYHSDNCRYSY
jgi:hypothetical protein